jgi:outer membrane protein OmpA-like peptidoglycan-associated protein
LVEAVNPLPVAFVWGRVHDPKGASVAATIVYHRLRDGAAAGSATADPVTGEYQIALPIGEGYGFRAEASGYVAVSEHVSLEKATMGDRIERDLTLIPIAVGAVVRLNNVFFRTGEAVLLPESRSELDRVVAALEASPRMAVEIAGHTDAEGEAAANQALSEARATAVVAYLSEHGIAGKRLVAKGYGETKPIASNASEAGRQENRRVELVVRER